MTGKLTRQKLTVHSHPWPSPASSYLHATTTFQKTHHQTGRDFDFPLVSEGTYFCCRDAPTHSFHYRCAFRLHYSATLTTTGGLPHRGVFISCPCPPFWCPRGNGVSSACSSQARLQFGASPTCADNCRASGIGWSESMDFQRTHGVHHPCTQLLRRVLQLHRTLRPCIM